MDRGKIMAEGSPTDLIKRYSSKEVLELRFGSENNQAVADQLQNKCDRIEILPDRILLYAEDAEHVLEEIMRDGMHPRTSLVRRSSLEDVFLRLTGRSLIE
jgi:lipooligosaccharide transport system ATP-binding protein